MLGVATHILNYFVKLEKHKVCIAAKFTRTFFGCLVLVVDAYEAIVYTWGPHNAP